MHRSNPFPSNDLLSFQGRGTINCRVTAQNPGRVYFQATYWPARLFQPSSLSELNPGEPVEVVGREGLTLLVKPLPQ
jgi:membrane protein implicated in regulation of membrane protease activity